jgi:4-amino-4-deoxy-L-arabinose transferase-like glycosyltransferase
MKTAMKTAVKTAFAKQWVTWLLLAAIVLGGILPFADRAFHMDEHIFLLLARSAQTNWMFPSDTPLLFFGTRQADFASHTHPPVGEYYLAIVDLVVGDFSEVPFRLLFAIFPIMAAIGFHGLARRYTKSPLTVTLLLTVSPAFFVMGQTIMMDMPMIAFLLLGTRLYFEHVDGKPRRLAPAALCFILAVGTGYTALVPLGCLFMWALYRRRSAMELVALAAAPIALSLWLTAMTVHFGRFPLTDTVRFVMSQTRSWFENLSATFSFLGGVSVFPFSFLLLTGLARRNWYRIVAGAFVVSTVITLPIEWDSVAYRGWFILLSTSGLSMLGAVAVTSSRKNGAARTESVFLLLWVLAVPVFFVSIGDMINARYILLALPPLYLLLFRDATPVRAMTSLGLTLALSLALATADYRFVNSYRSWVEDTLVPARDQGFRVWGAAESGLRFYMEENGIETLDKDDTRPGGGDMIVRQAGAFRYGLASEVEPLLVRMAGWDLNDSFPLRTFNEEAGAGFHDSRFGLVPFVLSSARFDHVDFVQFSPLVRDVVTKDQYPGLLVTGASNGVFLDQEESELTFPVHIPSDAEVRYDREGDGAIEIGSDYITLRKDENGPTVWWNIRIVPKSFPQ